MHASYLAENDYIATTSDVFYPPFLYLRLFYLQVVPTQWLVLKLILWNIYPLTNLNFSTNGWISLNSMICLNASECVFRAAHEICISFFSVWWVKNTKEIVIQDVIEYSIICCLAAQWIFYLIQFYSILFLLSEILMVSCSLPQSTNLSDITSSSCALAEQV